MDQLTREELRELVEVEAKPAVSIYMPAMKSGREVRQNEIRFNNLLKKLSAQLSDRGLRTTEIQHLLKRVFQLAENSQWWQHQSDGLVCFISPDQTKVFRLPIHFDEQIHIGSRYQVVPLIPLLQSDGRFYVIAVSQKEVRLFQGTRFEISQLEVENLPANLQAALNIDEYVESLQQHTTEVGRRGGTLFHGHGASDMDVQKKDEIRQFFHVLNRALADYLRDDRIPLVFAGVDYLFPIFKQTSGLKGLEEKAITGGVDRLKPKEIHEKAWAIVESRFQKHCDDALSRYRGRAGTELAIHDIDQIIQAAQAGQVETLLVAEDDQNPRTGNGDDSQGEFVNFAVVHTLAKGGEVFLLPREKLGGDSPACAVLRFPLQQDSAAAAAAN